MTRQELEACGNQGIFTNLRVLGSTLPITTWIYANVNRQIDSSP